MLLARLVCIFFCILKLSSSQYQPVDGTTTESAAAKRTRSLNGGPASDGNAEKNAELYNLLTLQIKKGFAVFKIKQYNDRYFLERTRRHYWFGDRYFRLDNYAYLSTRDTCEYAMNATERAGIVYEDDIPIYHIYYQCMRYEEFCCGLACCDRKYPPKDGKQMIRSSNFYDFRSKAASGYVISLSLFLLYYLFC